MPVAPVTVRSVTKRISSVLVAESRQTKLNRRCFPKTLALLACCLMAGAEAAQVSPASTAKDTPVAMVTRWVQLFGDLEQSLQTAVAQGNQPRIDTLLAEDFEMRIGTRPAEPIPRADWISQSVKHPQSVSSRTIEDMAAHDFGEIVVVSFKWRGSPDLFVVDIWKAVKGEWTLAARYADPAGPSSLVLPGAGRKAPAFEKKY